MTSIREIELERDAAGLAELIREINPTVVVHEAEIRHRHATTPPQAEVRVWIAENDGRLVGRSHCLRNFFSAGSTSAILDVAVRGAHRGRGIGSELYELALEHARTLDAEQLVTSFHENDAGTRFAAARGFCQARAETEAVLDPRDVTEGPPSDVDLVPVRDADPRLVWQVDLEATIDMPQTETIDTIPYEDWVQHVLENPVFSPDGSFVAMVDGVAAAVSLLTADLESRRAHNMFTGTLRAYRGRGLGLAVKLASIAWARDNGITSMQTHNDETNAPMLAINRRLGYRAAGRRVEWVRTGTASSPAPRAPAR